jgi:polyferredoxin
MAWLLTFLLGALDKILNSKVVQFVAWKALIWSIVVVTFPIVLINVWTKIVRLTFESVSSTLGTLPSGSLTSFFYTLTGLAAWLGQQLYIVEGFSILISAVMFRVMMRSIPLLRL